MFGYTDKFSDENKQKAKDIKKACELNKALCYLKVGDATEAKKACNAILKEDALNTKALFRMAQADVSMKNYIEAIDGLRKLLAEDPKNAEFVRLMQQAKKGQMNK